MLTMVAAAFEALYQVNPGRGRFDAVEAIWMKDPPRFCFSICGIRTLVDRKIDFALTFMHRSKSDS